MSGQISLSIGQYSDQGRKQKNQDFHAAVIPNGSQLSTKGIAIAIADGISSSDVSQIASKAAVVGFLEDYYCTSDAWSVKKSVQRVLQATNSWLYAQTQQSQFRYDKNRGYVCTFSALVIKSTTAHLFNVGDTRIYRLGGSSLEQLTKDHRLWVSCDQSYLSRALGMDSHLEIDYQTLQLSIGDIFLLTTDGVHEYVSSDFIIDTLKTSSNELSLAAKLIVDQAFEQGSTDNLTIQVVRIDGLPVQDVNEHCQSLTELPFPPLLDARMLFDGFTISRELHASSRSHVHLAVDIETKALVVIKTPSIDRRNDQAYLERFLMEDWIARRIKSPYVVKPYLQTRKRNYLYNVTEFVEGQTLTQWLTDNPKPALETVRGIVEQIAKGLRAFHRLEMLHQDIRPDNVMIDLNGTVKLIDFGSVSVAGIMEMNTQPVQNPILGTAQYTAPEYFLGDAITLRADLFSLGVITYQMLSGKLPYGTEVAKCKHKAARDKLIYGFLRYDRRDIPFWVDEAIKKAVHPDPYKRYEELSEFIFDLYHPNKVFLKKKRPPLLERNPMGFWKTLSLIQTAIILILLFKIAH